MSWASALYAGHVVHTRHKPRAHTLKYRVFSLLVDLDELADLDRSLALFGHNRRAVFSVHDADHGNGETGALKTWVQGLLHDAGIKADGLRVKMLCYPRMFGYVFNPLTVYFCEDENGDLKAILYEVCNTFKERHTYIIPVADGLEGPVSHECAKQLYVSPFLPMECTYRFRIMAPGQNVHIAINESDAEGPLLYAAFSGKRRELSGTALFKALMSYPLMTLKIMGAIHWEALLLWAKGVPVHRHKKAAASIASTFVPQPSATGGKQS